MTPFAALYERAAGRKGGPAELEKQLPTPKSAAELARLPDDRWLSGMSKIVFQAGFNWQVVDNKWPGFEEAFAAFDPALCAAFDDDRIDALLKDRRIIRNGAKVLSVRANAVFLRELATEYGSAGRCFADWPAEDFVGLLAMLKKRASRLSGRSAQYFLRSMGKDGFIISPDVATALIREGVVTKDPTSARDLKAVQEAFNAWRTESDRPISHISRVLAMTVEREMPEGRVRL
ncbi:MAG TPA: DNA-3-methyladenine glycosylase I [Alphaproteobacteria bacterium]|jgi:3-methyladenine DNA glycosylase Tag|nr:DNA-3-methyladenine glycosylase I [Alphaproteobacteria bacterium]MDP6269066.1 DNA-3-methyladenine glycosylase I [Alphaproteobacteria bacterium]MDP7164839.1 DNA-3-methyladenine glycosylase I [Alphaproteobacteria bacterium]MDP7427554.1 DNA-3-methyladenine glycosylase I [Alphaproteobacteria bacterium]HJM51928.1 DNA-3-methyladenine glycosylase I [Alphaproteobacteria bacterium]|tara:strand:- start:667 stop:1365 length:699 start_codon:yes stop_codon:yes gene_type:complete